MTNYPWTRKCFQLSFLFLRFNRRFHQIEMHSRVVWTVFLVYITQNVCFCDDPTGPVTAGVVASSESTKPSTESPPKVFVPPENYRLPRTVLPEFYKLNIFTHINDDEGFKFYGDVRIKVHTHTFIPYTRFFCLHSVRFVGLLTSSGACS